MAEIIDPRYILERITAAQREAAALLLHARGVLAENKTGHRDVVTEYDRQVQTLLMRRLEEALPGASFFCEENDRRDELDAGHLFIIDPIDGTMNFVHGFNHSCISAAYASRGTLLAAAVYNPYADEMFSAVKGGGAFLNGRPLRAAESALEDCVVCCGTSPYSPELTERSFEYMKRAFSASLDLRRQGSAELDLCSVAAGRAGAYFELSVSLWDWAAGGLIVREAGGVCLDLQGRELTLKGEKTSIVAGGKRAAAELCALLEG